MVMQLFSKDEPIQTSFFKMPRLLMSFLGTWPEQKITSGIVVRIIFNLVILGAAGGAEAIFGFCYLHRLILALEAFCPSTTKLVTFMKLVIFLIYKKEFDRTIKKLGSFLLLEKNPEKLRLIQAYSRTGALFGFFPFCAGMSTSTCYSVRPIITNILDYAAGRNSTNPLPFRVTIPETYIPYPYYPIIFALLFYSGMVTVFGFGGVDGCFMGFCCHISSVFETIQCEVKTLLGNLPGEMLSKAECDKVYDQMKRIVKKHNDTIDLCADFSRLYTIMTLAHFVSASLILCLSGFNFMLSTGMDSILYVSYSAAVLCELYMYCAGGTYLLEASSNIGEAAYFCEWYKCDSRIRKAIMLIIIRSGRGTGVMIPFFQPSLEAYGKIISTAGSYIALLKTFF